MNIFITDLDPVLSAVNLCDRHVPKMVLESCQMLSNLFHDKGNEFTPPYRKLMIKHPCSMWTLKSRENYEWLILHTEEIINQYHIRFNKTHKCEAVLKYCKDSYRKVEWSNTKITNHVLVMPLIYRNESVVDSYRSYIKLGKTFASWKKGVPAPDWMMTHQVTLNEKYVQEYIEKGIPVPTI